MITYCSRMSMEEVGPVIDRFCQILSLYGFSTINSKVLFAAKADRNGATAALWRLIYEILQSDRHEFLEENFDQQPKNQMVKTIKENLYELGYNYEQFLQLDEQMKKGSRQLLICLGWLIHHMKLIEKCMRYYLDSISNTDQAKTKQYVKSDLINWAQESLHSNRKISSRLREIAQGNLRDNAHMSDFERQLGQNPHLISPYLNELDNEYENLNLFLYWDKQESIFWKWMEGVLDQSNSSETLDVDYRHLETEKVKFNDALDTLDEILIRLKELWLSHDDRPSIENDLVSMIASIDIQISFLFNQLMNSNQSSEILSK